ncbi:MAG: hypothetical protein M1169_03640 [Firmicutes bacterium]|jgi:SAM-dependent methyltransferase|nr:hypothetical protein [Bacillota bacterium]
MSSHDKKIVIEKSKLLIVEGNHEKEFFEAMLSYLKLTDIQIIPAGGKTLILRDLPVLAKSAGFGIVTSIAVVRDADDNPNRAFQSVCEALKKSGLLVPDRPYKFVPDKVKVAVAILPNPDEKGSLEDLLLKASVNDPLIIPTNEFIDNAVSTLYTGSPRPGPAPHKQGKAKIHAFLATFDEPDRDLGKAAKNKVWDFSHSAFSTIQSLITQL